MIQPHPRCQFKTPLALERSNFLHETAQDLMYQMAEWASSRGLPFMVTETVTTLEEDQALDRVSSTHREARAFDLSTHGWSNSSADEFIAHFEKEYEAMAAIGAKSGLHELVLRHEAGHGDHFHVQLNRSFAIVDPLHSQRVGKWSWRVLDRNGAELGRVEAATADAALIVAVQVHGLKDAHSVEPVDPPLELG